MRLLAFVHNEWTALLAAELVGGSAPVVAVRTTEEMRRPWQRQKAATLVPVADGPPAVDAVLAGRGAPLDDLPPEITRLVVAMDCEDGVAVDDPLRWSVLNGYRTVRLHLRGSTVLVDIAGHGYGAAVTAVAAAVLSMLDDVSGLDGLGSTADVAAPADAPAAVALPVDRAHLMIDWSAPADQVARRVLAGADAITAAWTYLDGFPVSIGAAEAIAGRDHNVAPGTVVDRDGAWVTVQTGGGQVRISGVRDVVGPIKPALLRPGLLLGPDLVTEVVSLRGRVADLERVLDWLVGERDRPVPEAPARIGPRSVAS